VEVTGKRYAFSFPVRTDELALGDTLRLAAPENPLAPCVHRQPAQLLVKAACDYDCEAGRRSWPRRGQSYSVVSRQASRIVVVPGLISTSIASTPWGSSPQGGFTW